MTGKEVETVALLLKRVRERADTVKWRSARFKSATLQQILADDLAEGMKSLAAAVEMLAIEVADLRTLDDRLALLERGFEGHAHTRGLR